MNIWGNCFIPELDQSSSVSSLVWPLSVGYFTLYPCQDSGFWHILLKTDLWSSRPLTGLHSISNFQLPCIGTDKPFPVLVVSRAAFSCHSRGFAFRKQELGTFWMQSWEWILLEVSLSCSSPWTPDCSVSPDWPQTFATGTRGSTAPSSTAPFSQTDPFTFLSGPSGS